MSVSVHEVTRRVGGNAASGPKELCNVHSIEQPQYTTMAEHTPFAGFAIGHCQYYRQLHIFTLEAHDSSDNRIDHQHRQSSGVPWQNGFKGDTEWKPIHAQAAFF